MGNTTKRFSDIIKSNPLVTGSIAIAIVGIIGIAGITALGNGTEPTGNTKTAVAQNAGKDGRQAAEKPDSPATATTASDSATTAGDVAVSSSNSEVQLAAFPADTTSPFTDPPSQQAQLAVQPETPVAPTPNPAVPTLTPLAPAATPDIAPPIIIAATPAPASNLVANPSAEASTADAPAAWTQAFANGTNAPSYEYLQTGRTGAHSLKVGITGYESGDAKWVSAAIPVTPGKTYNIGDFYQTNSAANEVIVYDGTSGGYLAVLGVPPASAGWNQFSAQYTVPDGIMSISIGHALYGNGWLVTDDYTVAEVGTPDSTPIPTSVPAPVSNPQPVAAPAPNATSFSRPLISLTFDDGWKSIRTNGLPKLQQYGFTSTQYVNSDPIEAGFAGYMTPSDLRDFTAAGHEVAWHTRSHADLVGMDAATRNTELTVPGSFASTLMGLNVPMSTNFATPFGSYGSDGIVIDAIKANGWTSHRSTDVGFNTKLDLDTAHTRLTTDNIKVQNIVNTTSAAEVQSWISDAVATNSWLVIVYHEVSDGPVDPDPTYSASLSAFDQQLNAIKQSGVAVVTVDAALAELKPQL